MELTAEQVAKLKTLRKQALDQVYSKFESESLRTHSSSENLDEMIQAAVTPAPAIILNETQVKRMEALQRYDEDPSDSDYEKFAHFMTNENLWTPPTPIMLALIKKDSK